MNISVSTLVTVTYRATVTISVVNGPTPNIRDYVALYLPGAPTYFDWRYVGNNKTTPRPPKGTATGTVSFTVLKLGKFEAKLFSLTDAGVATLLGTTPFEILAPGGVVVPPPPPPPPTTLALLDHNLLPLSDETLLTLMEN